MKHLIVEDNLINFFPIKNVQLILCRISFFAKKVHYLPPKHASRTNSRNIFGRNSSMVIPLLANQDLTPMLFGVGAYPQSPHAVLEHD